MPRTSSSRCVMVGVDGSPNSLAALRRAAAEALNRHAVLEAVFVIGRDVLEGKPLKDLTPTARACLQHSVKAVLGDDSPVPVRLRVVAGEPGDVLARLADSAELLVIGARNDPDQRRPLGGETIPAVLAKSPCEVIVCADHRVSAGAP